MCVIPVFLSLAYGVWLWAIDRSWQKIPSANTPHPQGQQSPHTFVTVLIPVRNEAQNLGACLLSLHNQTYPNELFEILVIDDHSADETAKLARGTNVRLISLPEGHYGKKAAIREGIRQASGVLIASTDGDCILPPDWLRQGVAAYEKDRPVALCGPIDLDAGATALERFQQTDNRGMMALTAAAIRSGWFHLANGANLFYEKAAFEQVGGLEGHEQYASGDDVFLVQKLARQFPGKIKFLKENAAVVKTSPVIGWKAFWNQRLRWGAKTRHYREWRLLAMLALVFAVVWSILLGLIICFPTGLAALGIKAAADYWYLRRIGRWFGSRLDFWSYIPSQLWHLLYILVLGSSSWLFRNYSWKGRTLR